MHVSRFGTPHAENDASDAGIDPRLRTASRGTSPGQVFADLLLLGAQACQAPAAILSVPQAGGWNTLSHGFERRDGLNDAHLFDSIASSSGPVEFVDLVTSLPKSPLVLPPHSMRWAYGIAMRDADGIVVGVVAVMDRWVRQLTKREQRAMAALSRQMGGHLGQLRRGGEGTSPSARKAPGRGEVPHLKPTGVLPDVASTPRSRGVVDAPQLLRSHEVASIFDVTERTVINWAAAGKLPSLRTIGGHLRFRREDVMKLLSGAEEHMLR
jgi:excisionase family DNA binding protein